MSLLSRLLPPTGSRLLSRPASTLISTGPLLMRAEARAVPLLNTPLLRLRPRAEGVPMHAAMLQVRHMGKKAVVQKIVKLVPGGPEGWLKPPPPGKLPQFLTLPEYKPGERPIEMKRAWRIEIEHAGRTFLVHNGREMKKIKVGTKMVGHKFGEFSITRAIKRKVVVRSKQRGGKKKR